MTRRRLRPHTESASREFACPDCGRNCIVTQISEQLASIRHQLPECATYRRTKDDGQKFLELAFLHGKQRAAVLKAFPEWVTPTPAVVKR